MGRGRAPPGPRLLQGVFLLVLASQITLGAASLLSRAASIPFPGQMADASFEAYEYEDIVPESDLRSPDRKIWIVTTASLPWMTGTAVNPLLRAAYLTRGRPAGQIGLVIPWLEEEDQKYVYPHNKTFATQAEQEHYIRDWLSQRAGLAEEADKLNILFYPGKYHAEFGSIFSTGDVPALIPDPDADALILEEPEHLNWYRAPGVPWTEKFKHVVGICHTNYLVYSKALQGGNMKAAVLFFMNQWMCRAYCHKVIKLSGALQVFAPGKEEVENVHGVRQEFLDVGDKADGHALEGAYFIGKMMWTKGIDRLMPLMEAARGKDGGLFAVDLYGSGPDEPEIRKAALERNLTLRFHGAIDHAKLTNYKVFINPSVSEVLCTTVAEALAMGKFVICADHPSNAFFTRFANCRVFRTREEFATQVNWALNHVPKKLTPEERDTLSWEAATRRLIRSCMVSKVKGPDSHTKVDKALQQAHFWASAGKRGEALRGLAGGDKIFGSNNGNGKGQQQGEASTMNGGGSNGGARFFGRTVGEQARMAVEQARAAFQAATAASRPAAAAAAAASGVGGATGPAAVPPPSAATAEEEQCSNDKEESTASGAAQAPTGEEEASAAEGQQQQQP